MTQASAHPGRAAAAASTPPRVGALHWHGGKWRLVVVENRSGLTVLESTTLAGNPGAAVSDAAQRLKFDRLIRVAPGTQCVARCLPMPAADAAQSAASLRLIAEAQIPDRIPAHRRGAGIIPDAERNGSRTALLTGWEGEPESPGELSGKVAESWISPIAALAVLRGPAAGAAVLVDPSDGSVEVIASGPEKTVARALVEDASSPERFARAVAGVLTETCAPVGVTPPALSIAAAPVLALPAGAENELRSRVRKIPEQPGWLGEYGVALGAALTALSKEQSTRALAELQAVAPERRRSPVLKAMDWLAVRRNGWLAVAAAAVLLLVGPLAVGWARLAVLEAKSVGLGDVSKERAQALRRTALYVQLDQDRWPMTKLLADVSGATPVGVVVESLRLGPEQGLVIQGTADSAELVTTLQANLGATRLLSNIKVNRFEASDAGVDFDLSADIASPHGKAAGTDDFASKPLAVRLYGEGASNDTTPIVRRSAESGRESRRTASRPPPERSEGESPAPDRSAARPAPAPGEVPAALSDEAIGAMDRGAAMKEWANRKSFVQKNPKLDAGAKTRLDEEVRKLKDRMDKLAGAPAPGGTP